MAVPRRQSLTTALVTIKGQRTGFLDDHPPVASGDGGNCPVLHPGPMAGGNGSDPCDNRLTARSLTLASCTCMKNSPAGNASSAPGRGAMDVLASHGSRDFRRSLSRGSTPSGAEVAGVSSTTVGAGIAKVPDLPAAEGTGAKVGHIRAQLAGVAATLFPDRLVAGLAELPAANPPPPPATPRVRVVDPGQAEQTCHRGTTRGQAKLPARPSVES